MNITDLQMTLTLKPEDVKSIVKEYLERNGYDVLDKVKLNVGMASVGFGGCEHDEVEFKSVTVEVKKRDERIIYDRD